jgi:RNA polymerase sigma-70 factor, ECF subfamily
VTAPPPKSMAPAAAPVQAVSVDLRALFDAHYTATRRLLRRMGVPAAQLDDAAQEVFWVCARRLHDIRPGSETSFIYGVALRVASDHTRRSVLVAVNLEDAASVPAEGPSPAERLDERRARELLDTVLDRMPLDLRTVLVLVELEEMEVREVAGLLDIPPGTAASRLRRAREEFSAIARRLRARWTREGAR